MVAFVSAVAVKRAPNTFIIRITNNRLVKNIKENATQKQIRI